MRKPRDLAMPNQWVVPAPRRSPRRSRKTYVQAEQQQAHAKTATGGFRLTSLPALFVGHDRRPHGPARRINGATQHRRHPAVHLPRVALRRLGVSLEFADRITSPSHTGKLVGHPAEPVERAYLGIPCGSVAVPRRGSPPVPTAGQRAQRMTNAEPDRLERRSRCRRAHDSCGRCTVDEPAVAAGMRVPSRRRFASGSSCTVAGKAKREFGARQSDRKSLLRLGGGRSGHCGDGSPGPLILRSGPCRRRSGLTKTLRRRGEQAESGRPPDGPQDASGFAAPSARSTRVQLSAAK